MCWNVRIWQGQYHPKCLRFCKYIEKIWISINFNVKVPHLFDVSVIFLIPDLISWEVFDKLAITTRLHLSIGSVWSKDLIINVPIVSLFTFKATRSLNNLILNIAKKIAFAGDILTWINRKSLFLWNRKIQVHVSKWNINKDKFENKIFMATFNLNFKMFSSSKK